jgi:hypothetical protein
MSLKDVGVSLKAKMNGESSTFDHENIIKDAGYRIRNDDRYPILEEDVLSATTSSGIGDLEVVLVTLSLHELVPVDSTGLIDAVTWRSSATAFKKSGAMYVPSVAERVLNDFVRTSFSDRAAIDQDVDVASSKSDLFKGIGPVYPSIGIHDAQTQLLQNAGVPLHQMNQHPALIIETDVADQSLLGRDVDSWAPPNRRWAQGKTGVITLHRLISAGPRKGEDVEVWRYSRVGIDYRPYAANEIENSLIGDFVQLYCASNPCTATSPAPLKRSQLLEGVHF